MVKPKLLFFTAFLPVVAASGLAMAAQDLNKDDVYYNIFEPRIGVNVNLVGREIGTDGKVSQDNAQLTAVKVHIKKINDVVMLVFYPDFNGVCALELSPQPTAAIQRGQKEHYRLVKALSYDENNHCGTPSPKEDQLDGAMEIQMTEKRGDIFIELELRGRSKETMIKESAPYVWTSIPWSGYSLRMIRDPNDPIYKSNAELRKYIADAWANWTPTKEQLRSLAEGQKARDGRIRECRQEVDYASDAQGNTIMRPVQICQDILIKE